MRSTTAFENSERNHVLMGFMPLINKELGELLRPRSLLIQLLGWTLFLNGFLLVTLLVPREFVDRPELEPAERAELMEFISGPETPVMVFFLITGMAMAIAAVVTLQDAIIQEKQTGTAAWILSKPVTRLSFIMSKLGGHLFRLVFIIVLPQTLLAFVQLRLIGEFDINLASYLMALPMLLLFVLSFSTLTLMLGTWFESRAYIIGIPFFLIIAYQPLTMMLSPINDALPYKLVMMSTDSGTTLITQAILGQPLDTMMPLLFASLYVSLFTITAVLRFQHQEL
ncbi:MAG: ABC transporter permease subunit [Aggregatilineales bacterium]